MLILRKFRERIGAIPRATVRREARKFLASTRDCRATQHRVLERLLALNGSSHFSTERGLDQIRSVADFRRRLAISDYELYRPYIEQLQLGRPDALLGHRNRLLMFSMSSGTTDETKYIPVTKQFLRDYRRGWQTWGIHTLDQHPAINSRHILQYSSDYSRFHTAAGIPCGSISGLVAAMQKPIVRTMYTTPYILAKICDLGARNYTFLRLALADKYVALITTANPSTLLHLAKLADRRKADLIRDIADGTLCCSHEIAEPIRRKLRPRRNVARARELEQIVERTGHLYPKDYWPDLAVLAVWTGGSAGAYLPALPKFYGNCPVRDHGLSASEGRMTIPLADNTPGGILEVSTHFFEFIPEEEYESDHATVLEAHELQADRNYYILLTTSSGLYRYDICDVVRCTGFINTTPMLQFLHKGAHVSNLTGEKITESQVVSAVCASAGSLALELENFGVAPAWADPPRYELLVEHVPWLSADMRRRLAAGIDCELQHMNCEYREKRQSGRLEILTCVLVPQGTWSRFAAHSQRQRGSSPDQYKLPRLFPDLGFRSRLLAQFGSDASALQSGLSRGETGYRDAEGRAAHVVEPDAVTDHHARRVAAMFAADPDLQVGSGPASALDSDLH
jgi:hypothetical protein